MGDLLLNSSDGDDDSDDDYVPTEKEEDIFKNEMKALADPKVIENVPRNVPPSSSSIDEKYRIDKLWKQFLSKDVDDSPKKENPDTIAILQCDKSEVTKQLQTTTTDQFLETDKSEQSLKTFINHPTYESGISTADKTEVCKKEETAPTKSVPVSSTTKRSMGLNSLLGKIHNKKPKMNTLQKSLSDWESFKKDEGIDADLQIYNRGKSGYLERQAFLMRSDIRSFEAEKSLRLSKK